METIPTSAPTTTISTTPSHNSDANDSGVGTEPQPHTSEYIIYLSKTSVQPYRKTDYKPIIIII